MKNNNLKYGVILGLVVILCVVIYGLVWKNSIHDSGIADVTHIEDLDKLSIRLNYAFGLEENAELLLKGLKEKQNYLDDALQSDIIIIGSAKGRINQSNNSFGQEVFVDEVLNGEEFISANSTCYIYEYFGLQIIDDHIEYFNPLNVMQNNEKYLIFLKPSELNEIRDIKSYYLTSSILGYISLSNTTTPTIPREDFYNIELKDLRKYDFFSVSEDITKALNELRAEILENLLR